MNTGGKRGARIVIALDAAAQHATALDIVRCMISETFPELLGLFVEDVRLLEHAHSRLAREVVLSGAERPLELGALSRQLRAQSEQVRRSFEAAAATLGLPHTFQVARGEFLAALANRAAEAEALVVSLAPGKALAVISTVPSVPTGVVLRLASSSSPWSGPLPAPALSPRRGGLPRDR